MATDKNPIQVIRAVSVNGPGQSRLTLQSICGSDGKRYIRAVWEEKSSDGGWAEMGSPPFFNARVWTDVFSKAATSGMLSSSDYKELLVRLTRGLDASKSPTPKAYVRVAGKLKISFDDEALATNPVSEVLVHDALSSPLREVTVTQSHQRSVSKTHLVYSVSEDIHYTEALSRLPEELRTIASKSSLEVATLHDPQVAFESLFGDPELVKAGFGHDVFEVEYTLSVL